MSDIEQSKPQQMRQESQLLDHLAVMLGKPVPPSVKQWEFLRQSFPASDIALRASERLLDAAIKLETKGA